MQLVHFHRGHDPVPTPGRAELILLCCTQLGAAGELQQHSRAAEVRAHLCTMHGLLGLSAMDRPYEVWQVYLTKSLG